MIKIIERYIKYAVILLIVYKFIELFEKLVYYSAISSDKLTTMIEIMQKSRLFR